MSNHVLMYFTTTNTQSPPSSPSLAPSSPSSSDIGLSTSPDTIILGPTHDSQQQAPILEESSGRALSSSSPSKTPPSRSNSPYPGITNIGDNTPPRPGLSRTSSVSSTYLADTDDSLTGLTLLDLLVAVDAHLDLASREIKRKGQEWRVKAESTAISVKRQAEEVINNQRRLRRRVTGKTPRKSAEGGANAATVESDDDRIDIDRELQKFREKLQGRVATVRAKWKDQRVVSLRDKISFFFGVELVLFSALLVGFKPEWIPGVYTALSLYLFPIRIYEYRRKHYSLFLYDLCYIVNVMCLAYIWIFPKSSKLFLACYCLAHGPLCTAIATWRNSLVFHSVDKVTSLFIHVYPPFVFTTLRHFYPNVEETYPALAKVPHVNVWQSLIFSSIAYLIWQVAYYYYVIVARKDLIEKQGRVTSFTYMLNNKRSLIGKTLAKISPEKREASFMAGQFVYAIVTMAPSAIWLYDSKVLSVVWLLVFFSVSVWNGASFYFKIMSNSKEVASLRKELESLQKEIEGSRTPASQASMPLSEPGDVSLGPSAVASPELAPTSLPAEANNTLNSISVAATSQQQQQSGKESSANTATPSVEPELHDDGVPHLKLDEHEGNSQHGSNDTESDTSAVVVDAEDGVSS